MPWKEASVMSQRMEFVKLAEDPGSCLRALCRHFGVSAPTAYKWLERYRQQGLVGLVDRSRRPHHSPSRVSRRIEEAVIELRRVHGWGGRKIRSHLLLCGMTDVPSHTTVTDIYRRHGLMDTPRSPVRADAQRFEAPQPNLLWQMDFKGDFALSDGRCYPLTILDDHSRFALGLMACGTQKRETVQGHLINVFRQYGLPQRFLTDNGAPWGSCGHGRYTALTLWLIRLGISMTHSRVCHPQTLGKDERFHRTLNYEVISRYPLPDLDACQRRFDWWRNVYNRERPHEALNDAVPASRYAPSSRPYPDTLPAIEYQPSDQVRKVDHYGWFNFHGRLFKLGKAFGNAPIALRPTTSDGTWEIYYCQQPIASLDLKDHTSIIEHP